MDLVISNATVITMNASREVLRDAEVVIQNDRIVKVGAPRKGRKTGVRRSIDARGKVVLPGLIHSHLHACQTLCRNAADGLELLDWLRERIWPFEAAHDAQSLRASADITFMECIRSGATSILDMGTVRHYDSVFESARDSGVRLVGGKCMMDAGQGVPMGLRETTQSSLDESIRLIDTWHGTHNGRLRYALAPRFVLSCTEALMKQVAVIARERGVRIHTHASENPTECDVVRQKTGMDNVAYFNHIGLLGKQTTLAHCVWLTAEEQKLLRDTQTRVAHCPSANFKLASGTAKIPELLQQKIVVGLGADGAPCNNNLDIFVELRLAALIHLPRTGPTSLSAMQALELATLNGARALGLEGEVGVLQEGARADVITVDLSQVHSTPNAHDPVSTLVYSGQSRDVRDVVVDGQILMRDRHLLTMDEAAVLEAGRSNAARLLAKLD
ncbi:MAG: N-ethylammeline chlorohydrolase [Archangium gephyra]|uniref:N-ethylammeline chlorohydrolase n=1 Tax=Archangium gephyra TaxID=48 RepID=A0A2W5U7P4_9BACT|nr:MAG: N-ethylammeline chlorohydrolase [Archangium gephyra]